MPKLKCLSSEDGAVLVLTVVILVVLIAVAALALDIGVLYVAAQQSQNTADAAALAGATAMKDRDVPGHAADATYQAMTVAAANRVLGDPVVLDSGDVEVGGWNTSTKEFVTWDSSNPDLTPAVKVTVRRTEGSSNGPVPTFFAKVLGLQFLQVTRRAIAAPMPGGGRTNPLSLMEVQDASSSFQPQWKTAIAADKGLLDKFNQHNINGDAAGIVAFNATIDDNWLRSHNMLDIYNKYPDMNKGIKWTTSTSGYPMQTDDMGNFNVSGLVRPMATADASVNPFAGTMVSLDANNKSTLPDLLTKAGSLLTKGNAWGDTDTAAGLNYAIDRLVEHGGLAGTDRVILLISDGKPHDYRDGGNGPYTQARDDAAIAAADRAGDMGIVIDTVTLEGSSGANYQFNEGLVRNGGTALRVADAGELADALGLLLQPFLNKPALVE